MPKKKSAQIEESQPAEGGGGDSDGGAPEERAGAAEPGAAEPAPKPASAPAAPASEPAGGVGGQEKAGGVHIQGAEEGHEGRASQPELSAKQRQLSKAWGQYCRSVDRQYTGILQGVEREVVGVNKGLQSGQNAANEVLKPLAQNTQKNVRTAKDLLGQISQALESVDTLVVPIVLQREGNF